MTDDKKEPYWRRRDFIKTAAMAVAGATSAVTDIYAKGMGILLNPQFGGGYGENINRLLCLSEFPEQHEEMLNSIRTNHGIDLHVSLIKVDYGNPWNLMESIRRKNADILFLCTSRRIIWNYGKLSRYLAGLDIPILVYSPNQELIMIDANFVAEIRVEGGDDNVKLAVSEIEVTEILKETSFPGYFLGGPDVVVNEVTEDGASPGFMLDKKALIYGRPFDSVSVPARILTEEYVYDRAGVEIVYRPVNELVTLLEEIDDSSAMAEVQRWRDEAAGADELPPSILIDQCRLYILLRSIIEEEGLSAISIDCLSFTLGLQRPILPIPCLAFARLRDEGITASCEADVCGLLSSMVFEKVSGRSTFFANVASVDKQKSSAVLRHCAAPLKMMGPDSSQLPYKLHDYHQMGRGLVSKVGFPVGIDVTMGSYTKDLKGFVLWPGRSCASIDDTNTNRFCANKVEVEIEEAERFFQNIANLHYVMVAGDYTREIADVMASENVTVFGPS